MKVKVKCAACGETREIEPGEIADDDFPMCSKCYMPMMPVEAKE